MTLAQAIERLDYLKPNQYDEKTKIQWLTELDGQLYHEILLSHEDCPIQSFSGYDDTGGTLLAPEPYSQLYLRWLEAQVDYHNAELEKYNNSMAMFLAAWDSFERWYNRHHRPLNPGRIRF